MLGCDHAFMSTSVSDWQYDQVGRQPSKVLNIGWTLAVDVPATRMEHLGSFELQVVLCIVDWTSLSRFTFEIPQKERTCLLNDLYHVPVHRQCYWRLVVESSLTRYAAVIQRNYVLRSNTHRAHTTHHDYAMQLRIMHQELSTSFY